MSKDAKPQNVQINISLPRIWKELLENLARIMAAEETHNLTWHDLIRRAVKENPSFQMNQSRHSSHSTYLCRYHLIFCPKFRFNVLKDGVDETLKEILQKICDSYRYEVQAMEVRPDHIHLFLSAPQTAVPADIARTIKSISAIELFKAYPDLKHFYPEQFIKTDKWPETPLKNVFPAILLFTKQVSVNRSSFLYNISHTHQKERILNNDTHPEQQYGRFYS